MHTVLIRQDATCTNDKISVPSFLRAVSYDHMLVQFLLLRRFCRSLFFITQNQSNKKANKCSFTVVIKSKIINIYIKYVAINVPRGNIQ